MKNLKTILSLVILIPLLVSCGQPRRNSSAILADEPLTGSEACGTISKDSFNNFFINSQSGTIRISAQNQQTANNINSAHMNSLSGCATSQSELGQTGSQKVIYAENFVAHTNSGNPTNGPSFTYELCGEVYFHDNNLVDASFLQDGWYIDADASSLGTGQIIPTNSNVDYQLTQTIGKSGNKRQVCLYGNENAEAGIEVSFLFKVEDLRFQ